MEEGVEPRDALAGGGGFDVLEEGGEAADDLARVQVFGDADESLEIDAGLGGAGFPQADAHFVDASVRASRRAALPTRDR